MSVQCQHIACSHADSTFSAWSWPDIPGLREFQGHLCHSADFGSGLDFAGKQVAVLGNGSSGIQIVPEMQKVASKVVNFARSKTVGLSDLEGTDS